MLDSNAPTDRYETNEEGWSSGPGSHQSAPAVLWRFKLLVICFAVCGCGIGYWIYSNKPATYRSSTKLMFKSDKPLQLDSSTGSVVGGLPGAAIMEEVMYSDGIIDHVVNKPSFKSHPEMRKKSPRQLAQIARSGLRFRTLTDEKDSRERLVASVGFEYGDGRVCEGAVAAFSEAIESYFVAERESSLDELKRLIAEAQSKLLQPQQTLEEEYKNFRQTAQLQWGTEGQLINPHREKQFQLQSQEIALEQELRDLNYSYQLAQGVKQKRADDPVMVAEIIGQIPGNQLERPDITGGIGKGLIAIEDDLTLQKIQVEKTLIPLQVQLEELQAAYAESHPQVAAVATQVESTQRKLNELNARILERKREIQSENGEVDPGKLARNLQIKRAERAIELYLGTVEEKIALKERQIKDIRELVQAEKEEADKLKKDEDDDASYQRKLASLRGMRNQLERRLAELRLVDEKGGITVKPMLSASNAYKTGPNLASDLIVYGMVGLGVGALLAMLIEASAKMFRSAEELQRELRLPVLTHVPVDQGKISNVDKTVHPEIGQLDPQLSVVHRPYSPAAEAIRAIRTSVLFDRRQHDSRVFQVTSPLPGDGKSTIAANVACSLSQSGKRTILIDLDLRSPRLSLRFNLQSKQGLTNVLNGELAPQEATHETPIENLDIMPCGPLPANPAEALTLEELSEVIEWAKNNYEFVIVDTPPLLMVSDPVLVNTHVDAALMVMRVRRRSKPNGKEAVAMLRGAGARVLGVIVNKVDELAGNASYEVSASGSYQSIGYGYGDKYRQRYQKESATQDNYVVKGRAMSGTNGTHSDRVPRSKHQRNGADAELASDRSREDEFVSSERK